MKRRLNVDQFASNGGLGTEEGHTHGKMLTVEDVEHNVADKLIGELYSLLIISSCILVRYGFEESSKVGHSELRKGGVFGLLCRVELVDE